MSIINTNSSQKSSQRAFSLQKYLLLHSQQDALRKQISSLSSTYSESRSSSSSPVQHNKSLSSTPPSNPYTHTHLRTRRNPQSYPSSHSLPSSSFSNTSASSSSSSSSTSNEYDSSQSRLLLSTSSSATSSLSTSPESPTFTSFPDPLTLQQLSIEQSKLKDVNLQIKTTLTELLNSEGVKEDSRFRGWVQSRLMSVERELRDGRSLEIKDV